MKVEALKQGLDYDFLRDGEAERLTNAAETPEF